MPKKPEVPVPQEPPSAPYIISIAVDVNTGSISMASAIPDGIEPMKVMLNALQFAENHLQNSLIETLEKRNAEESTD